LPLEKISVKFWDKFCGRILEDTSTTGTKFSTLDGLRGLAVLTVFLSHSSGFRQRLSPWTSFHGTGHLGVYLFFVLSGFLLAWSLLSSARINFGGFYMRRFFRIAPLFYLVVTAVFACQLATGVVDLFNLHIKGGNLGYIKHLLFYQGDSVFWTIAAEFEFYIILPFIALFLMRYGRMAAISLSIFAVAYGTWYVLIEAGKIDPRWSLKVAGIVHHSQYLDVFVCGILTAWMFRKPNFEAMWESRRGLLHSLATVVGFTVLVISLLLVAENIFGFGRNWRNAEPWWNALHLPKRFGPASFSMLYGAAFGFIALAALNGHSLLQPILNNRLLRVIGVTGFSWYLIHFPVIRIVNWLFGFLPTSGANIQWTSAEPIACILSFIITFAVAAVLYLLVEKPFMMMSRNLLRRKVCPA
jgi:peptidoglycan/LPS O-acetylase OafA/YrhL